MKNYLLNAAVGLDVFVNVLTGGHPDETISARSGRAKAQGKLWGRLLGGALNKVFPGHTDGAELHDEQRAETVEEIEQRALKPGGAK